MTALSKRPLAAENLALPLKSVINIIIIIIIIIIICISTAIVGRIVIILPTLKGCKS